MTMLEIAALAGIAVVGGLIVIYFMTVNLMMFLYWLGGRKHGVAYLLGFIGLIFAFYVYALQALRI